MRIKLVDNNCITGQALYENLLINSLNKKRFTNKLHLNETIIILMKPKTVSALIKLCFTTLVLH